LAEKRRKYAMLAKVQEAWEAAQIAVEQKKAVAAPVA